MPKFRKNRQELVDSYLSARQAQDAEPAREIVKDARRLLRKTKGDDWTILAESLVDPEGKWLVAEVFSKAPVPKKLKRPMLRAAVYEVDPSYPHVRGISDVVSYEGHEEVR